MSSFINGYLRIKSLATCSHWPLVGFTPTLLIMIETKVLTISFLLSLDNDFCLMHFKVSGRQWAGIFTGETIDGAIDNCEANGEAGRETGLMLTEKF